MPLFAPTGITELGYAEDATDVTATTGSPNVDIPGCVVTVTVGARPILIKAQAYVFNSNANGYSHIDLKEGGTALKTNGYVSSAANDLGFVYLEYRTQPSAGSHTYKLVLRWAVAGTSHAYGPISALQGPTFIQVLQL